MQGLVLGAGHLAPGPRLAVGAGGAAGPDPLRGGFDRTVERGNVATGLVPDVGNVETLLRKGWSVGPFRVETAPDVPPCPVRTP